MFSHTAGVETHSVVSQTTYGKPFPRLTHRVWKNMCCALAIASVVILQESVVYYIVHEFNSQSYWYFDCLGLSAAHMANLSPNCHESKLWPSRRTLVYGGLKTLIGIWKRFILNKRPYCCSGLSLLPWKKSSSILFFHDLTTVVQKLCLRKWKIWSVKRLLVNISTYDVKSFWLIIIVFVKRSKPVFVTGPESDFLAQVRQQLHGPSIILPYMND